jgi:hypothetical protein
MSVIRRRVVTLVAVPVLALMALGCANVTEQTQAWRDAPNGTSATAGEMDIRNALVVSDSEGNGTVFASFANRGGQADALTGVIVDDIEATSGAGDVELPAGGVASVAADGARVDVSGMDVAPGRIVDVQFIFANAPRVSVQAIVQPNDGIYADVTFP